MFDVGMGQNMSKPIIDFLLPYFLGGITFHQVSSYKVVLPSYKLVHNPHELQI